MKLLTTLLIAVLAALMVYTIRRRVWFALKVGAVVYMVALFGRLLLSSFSWSDRSRTWSGRCWACSSCGWCCGS